MTANPAKYLKICTKAKSLVMKPFGCRRTAMSAFAVKSGQVMHNFDTAYFRGAPISLK